LAGITTTSRQKNKRDDLAEKIAQNRLLTFVYKFPPRSTIQNTKIVVSAKPSVGREDFFVSRSSIDVTFFRVCCSNTFAKKNTDNSKQLSPGYIHALFVV
jgi:hypothetical protein